MKGDRTLLCPFLQDYEQEYLPLSELTMQHTQTLMTLEAYGHRDL